MRGLLLNVMNLGRAISTFGKNAALRLGSQAAARHLLEDLNSPDENVRMLAGMFLVRNGERSLPVLFDALKRREQLPTVLTILGDIATPACEREIVPFLHDSEPAISTAAHRALDALRRNRDRRK